MNRIMLSALSVACLSTSMSHGFDTNISNNASILFYNAPAAVALPNGYAAGVISGSGDVVIVELDHLGNTVRERLVHQYGKQDDHAAPAIWLHNEDLLIATSFHSSDLFVYLLPSDGGDPVMVCQLNGRFTYPRFYQGDGIKLLVRQDQQEHTAEVNYRGMLAEIPVSENGCGEPVNLIDPGFRTWIYAAPPAVVDGQVVVAWSAYDKIADRHLGVFTGVLPGNGTIRDTRTLVAGQDVGDEVVAYGVGYWHQDAAISYIVFSGGYECCNTGTQTRHIVSLDGLPLFRAPPSTIPYYPDHLALADAPKPQSNNCAAESGTMQAPIHGGDGVIYMQLGKSHQSKNFDSAVRLCLN